ncbi:hypothetical protein Y032_0540g3158 [Ancylostoma ceylanicum]|uniref:Uncharacterized protein n=1 Tax=Ancylostoma ceylanicum TaxID=53326 RepID=A0A016WR96_9BILA|nr:hypothetical protein Y032_0540g3158 [Ancylostoma ceylanicum]
MHRQPIQVIFFYELLFSTSASNRGDYIIIAFGPVFATHLTMNHRLSPSVSEDTSPQRHLPTRRPPGW